MSELNVDFLAPKQPISLNLQGSETPTTQKTPTIPVKSEENLDTFQKTGPIEEAPAAKEETVAVQEQAKEGTNKKKRKGLNFRKLFTKTFWQGLGKKIEDALEAAWKWFWGEPENK